MQGAHHTRLVAESYGIPVRPLTATDGWW
jgi:hypothetical protein